MDDELVPVNGQEVRRHRKQARLRQNDLAERAGFGQDYISKVELGRIRRVPPETVRKLAAALGMDPSRLTSSAIGTVPTTPLDSIALLDDALALLGQLKAQFGRADLVALRDALNQPNGSDP